MISPAQRLQMADLARGLRQYGIAWVTPGYVGTQVAQLIEAAIAPAPDQLLTDLRRAAAYLAPVNADDAILPVAEADRIAAALLRLAASLGSPATTVPETTS